jgi:hypothetical protein
MVIGDYDDCMNELGCKAIYVLAKHLREGVASRLRTIAINLTAATSTAMEKSPEKPSRIEELHSGAK